MFSAIRLCLKRRWNSSVFFQPHICPSLSHPRHRSFWTLWLGISHYNLQCSVFSWFPSTKYQILRSLTPTPSLIYQKNGFMLFIAVCRICPGNWKCIVDGPPPRQKPNYLILILSIAHLWTNNFSTTFQDTKGGESEHINLKVLGQDNAVVQFKIKKHTPLRKLMNAYCDRAVSINPFFLNNINRNEFSGINEMAYFTVI